MADRRAEFLSVQISMAAVAVFAVVLRLISRFMVTKSPGWDDYIIAMGACLGLTQTMLTLSCVPYGAAKHMADITSRSDLMYILKIAYVACITGPLIMMSVKASLLLLYLRISPCAIFRRCVKFLLVLFTLDAIVFSVLAVFQCLPIDHSWKWTKPGHCTNRQFLYKAQGLWNLTENIVIIILPMPTILGLQMRWRRRMLLMLVFAVGLVPCGAVIARVIPNAPAEVFTSDFTWWLVSMQNWITVEYSTGMVCASLILLRPLLQMLCGTRRTASATWPGFPGQPKRPMRNCAQAQRAAIFTPYPRSQSGEAPGLPTNKYITIPTMPALRSSADRLTVEDESYFVTAERPRPLSYLKDLQSPDVESSLCEDPFSQLSNQSRYSCSAVHHSY